MHAYERWTVRRYVANALKTSRFAKPPRPGSDIVAWLDEHAASVGLAPRVRRQGSRRNAWDEDPPYVEDWATWRRESFVLASGGAPGASPLQKWIDWLSHACGLTEEQSEALGLLARLTPRSQAHNRIQQAIRMRGRHHQGPRSRAPSLRAILSSALPEGGTLR